MTRALLGLWLLLAGGTFAQAQEDVAAFYKGKTIRLLVGIGVGSGYDINARLLARHLAGHIPGQPTIIVQNQPGAGSLTMTNALYNNGPFDGTVIGASFNGMPTTPLLQPAGARFDPVKLNWLGSTNRETQVSYVWHTAPVQKLADVKTTQIVMGAQAPGSTQFDYPVLANSLFGFKFKVVTGYESTPKIHLAMESGEVHGTIANWSTLKAINTNWINEKKIRILAQWALKKNPELGDVPFFFDLAQDRRGAGRTAADAGAAGIRPAVLPAAERAGRARRGAAPRVRRHHEGPGLSGRGRPPQGRGRSADRRAGRGPGRAGLAHATRDRRRACAPRWRSGRPSGALPRPRRAQVAPRRRSVAARSLNGKTDSRPAPVGL